jgi:hypothetical protein
VTPFNPGPPPQPPPRGSSPVIWFFALLGIGTLVVGGGGFAWLVSRGIAESKSAAEATKESAGPSKPRAKLPSVERQVPQHALSLLDGCSNDDLLTLRGGIDGAIEIGAPLYNAGNFAGCYHLYEGTAADLERKVGDACAGPRSALESGRARAASSSGPSAQAWAMRDAFDGLLDVIARSDSSK